ncbi:hypothetical protein C476_08318 [Natrinema limicola JCM 13563]|uniref:Uncharacterized protein n=1 Tax=Natrinema limicola JCM 13563 TaxID=1230457 RepID=M0CDY0_9EURY|nr:hypothetical protein C476_08318 [Natrinema limicola JCM 13563]
MNKQRIEELQARELEKGTHLFTETVDHHEIAVDGDQLERTPSKTLPRERLNLSAHTT